MSAQKTDVARKVSSTVSTSTINLTGSRNVTKVSGIRVIDVGQGDCIGILDQKDEIFCYVDFGGFHDHPEAGQNSGNPSAHRMPAMVAGHPVPIILTHWDKDHYWSADKKNAQAQKNDWIVPRQFVSPQAAVFASGLSRAARWPDNAGANVVSVPVCQGYEITIRRCQPFDKNKPNVDRNRSGLAVTIVRHIPRQAAEVMILPGDCPFDLIPRRNPGSRISAIVAYHHGSKSHWTAATRRAIHNRARNASLAYSFGKNRWGHPHRIKYRMWSGKRAFETPVARRSGKLGLNIKW